MENFEFCLRVLLEKLRRCDLSLRFVVFWRFRKACEPSEVPHLSAKTEVRPIELHIDSLARSDLEKHRKSQKNRRNIDPRSPLRSLGRPRWLERVPRSMLGDSGLMLRQFLVRFFVAFRGCFTRASRCAARPQRRAPTRKARFSWLDWPTARQAASNW